MSRSLVRRLQTIRGGARLRSPSVGVLAWYASHTDCALAGVAFSARVDIDSLLKGTRYQMPFGQSPFAFARGKQFEQQLRHNDHAPLRQLLGSEGEVQTPVEVVNLREGYPLNRQGMRQRAEETRRRLQGFLADRRENAAVIDGAVLHTSLGGLPAYFEADAVAACLQGRLHVAEIKSFPRVDGRVDPEKLGAALDQVAIYLWLMRRQVLELDGDPDQAVSDLALLITPQNVGLTPTLSRQRVGSRIARVEKLLERIPAVESVVEQVPETFTFGPIADPLRSEERRLQALHQLTDQVGNAYRPECVTNCGNARFCRDRMIQAGSPCVLGSHTERFLPGIDSFARVEELAHGAAPSESEQPAAELLTSAADLLSRWKTPENPITQERRVS